MRFYFSLFAFVGLSCCENSTSPSDSRPCKPIGEFEEHHMARGDHSEEEVGSFDTLFAFVPCAINDAKSSLTTRFKTRNQGAHETAKFINGKFKAM